MTRTIVNHLQAVNKVQDDNIVNRRGQAEAILAFLKKFAPVTGDYIGHLPTTGDIVDAIGRERNNASFASVSRTLRRLEAAGKIAAYQSTLCIIGKGYRYGLTKERKA
jgi:hypothetical protein